MSMIEVPATAYAPKSHVERPSKFSLKVEMLFQGKSLAHGTGFLTNTKRGIVLITARHNLTGRHHKTSQCLHSKAALPDEIDVHFCVEEAEAHIFMTYRQPLFLGDNPRWFEHPILGSEMDVAALPISAAPNKKYHGLNVSDQIENLTLRPTSRVNVIGFPDMATSEQERHKFPVWATGFIASEPNIRQENTFLIDCRGRSGQSGAPVI